MNHRIALVTLDLSNDDKRMYHFMAKSLSKAGWRVEMINTTFEGKGSERIYYRKAMLPSFGMLKRFSAHKAMMNGLLESRADIAVFFDAELLKMLPKAKKLMPIQVIFDINREAAEFKSLLKRKLIFADAVITDAENKADYIMEHFNRSCTVITDEYDSDLLISLCDELERGGRYNI